MTSVRNSLLAVNFGISCWEARRQDKSASKEVADNHGTASSVGRYHKDLLPGCVEHEAILKLRNAWRVWHMENTLPWSDNGVRVIRSASFLDYSQGFKKFKDEFDAAVDAFIDAYPQAVARASLHLNSLFNKQDYPDVEEVRRRFASRMQVFPMPNEQDFRILEGVPAEEVERLQAEAVVGMHEQVTYALKDLWQRMHKVAAAMSERLAIPHGAPGGKFHDTLVDNIADLLKRVPALNLTGDPEIDRISDEMRGLLCQPETLRVDPDARADKAEKARLLAKRMAAFVGD